MRARSDELLSRAHEALAAARTLVSAAHAATAISTAYHAMLYAARAALSERDRNARSHSGTWAAFREEFVVGGAFDADLVGEAQRAQARRESATTPPSGSTSPRRSAPWRWRSASSRRLRR